MILKITIDDEFLEEIKDEIATKVVELLKGLNQSEGNSSFNMDWIDEIQAKAILGYRSKTKMQELRSSRSIEYAKYGRKIKYLRQSLIDFLEKNKKTNTYNYGSK